MQKGPRLPAADGGLAAVVRRAIAASLVSGRTSLTGVATTAGLSVRSLQRRLAAEGLTYSQLREEIRRDAACRLIDDNDFSLAQVASALGYSDPAHFTRAFVRWHGVTPRAYRERANHACRK
ncbi:MAG: helix-turn-helix transcriptional regulator [Kiloniellales bacterium]|nr:helix-turn-helix transcriptional regulator [Kiloniellales bacterium]